jgi:hypothetical protein
MPADDLAALRQPLVFGSLLGATVDHPLACFEFGWAFGEVKQRRGRVVGVGSMSTLRERGVAVSVRVIRPLARIFLSVSCSCRSNAENATKLVL